MFLGSTCQHRGLQECARAGRQNASGERGSPARVLGNAQNVSSKRGGREGRGDEQIKGKERKGVVYM